MSDKLEALSQPAAYEVKGCLCHTIEEAEIYVGQPEPLYSQEYVTALLAALEEANKRAEAESVGADKSAVNAVEWMKRANAAEQREEHLKATVDVLSAKNAELERRLQQPIKLRKCDIGIACEFVSEHVVVSLAAVMVEAATAGFKAEVEGE